MADTQLKAGDVVKLASGGPKMVISSISLASGDYLETARCMWFVEGESKYHDFPTVTLVRTEREK